MAFATSMVPVLVIGGLMYAAFFVKADAVVSSVRPPEIERRDRFLGVAVPAKGLIWAAGSNGKVVRSEDGGRNWMAQATPTVENLQGIATWSGEKAVAVGGNGVVIVTENSGRAWQEVAVPKSEVANKLLTVRAYGDGVAWAVGEMGAVLKTADFGRSWTRAIPEKDQAWNDICFVGKQGLLVGEFGQILRTVDGGESWSAVASGVQSSLMSVALRSDSEGVAVGLSGTILVTHDGGLHWTPVPPQTREHLNNVIWDGGQWVAVGDKGAFATGGPDGRSWKVGRVSEGNLGWNTQIAKADADRPGDYVLAGASLARLADGRLSVFGRSAD